MRAEPSNALPNDDDPRACSTRVDSRHNGFYAGNAPESHERSNETDGPSVRHRTVTLLSMVFLPLCITPIGHPSPPSCVAGGVVGSGACRFLAAAAARASLAFRSAL